MRLAEYLVSKGLKQAEFARMMGCTAPCVHNWIYRKSLPSSRQMIEVYKITGGRVALKDWMEETNGSL